MSDCILKICAFTVHKLYLKFLQSTGKKYPDGWTVGESEGGEPVRMLQAQSRRSIPRPELGQAWKQRRDRADEGTRLALGRKVEGKRGLRMTSGWGE